MSLSGFFYDICFLSLECMCVLNFLCSNLVLKSCDEVYYGVYEEFVWVVVLGGWSLDMVVCELYVVEAICNFVYVMRGVCVFAKANQWHIIMHVVCFGTQEVFRLVACYLLGYIF